jgi:hypothetical protein
MFRRPRWTKKVHEENTQTNFRRKSLCNTGRFYTALPTASQKITSLRLYLHFYPFLFLLVSLYILPLTCTRTFHVISHHFPPFLTCRSRSSPPPLSQKECLFSVSLSLNDWNDGAAPNEMWIWTRTEYLQETLNSLDGEDIKNSRKAAIWPTSVYNAPLQPYRTACKL